MDECQYSIYIVTNKNNTVLYTGVTSNLKKRIFEHREKLADGFTKKYRADKLVYFEIYNDIHDAITREKQIKSGSRRKKLDMINELNPEWHDLYEEI